MGVGEGERRKEKLRSTERDRLKENKRKKERVGGRKLIRD